MQGKKLTHIIVVGVECKPCSRCGASLPLDEYSRSKIMSDGLRSACKKCERLESIRNYAKNVERDIARARAWQAANPEKVKEIDRKRNNESRKAWRKEWKKQNPERVKEYALKNYEKLKARGYFSAYKKQWREGKNRTTYLEWLKRYTDKRRSTPKGVIDHRMNTALRLSLKGGKNYRKWTSLVGYTVKELIERLNETMPDGYSWEQIGELHIDHIIPKSRFKYKSDDSKNFKECWALENLQFLPALANISKGNKIT